jgi:uncharacterized protein (DUF697 family)
MDLAAELLSVTNEGELDHFLGNIFGKKGLGRVFRGPMGRILKNVAKTSLSIAGAALGSVVPGVGTAIGGALGGMASNFFEIETEGLSPEDRDL